MKDMETMKREIRTFYEQEAPDVIKSMELGDIDTVNKYLETMLKSVRESIIHKHTGQRRLDEIAGSAKVAHGAIVAKLLEDTQTELNQIIPKQHE